MKHIIFAIVCFVAFFVANYGVYLMLSKISFLSKFARKIKGIFVVIFLLEVLFVVLMRRNFLNDEIYAFLAILLGFSFFFFLVAVVFLFVEFIYKARKSGALQAIKSTLSTKQSSAAGSKADSTAGSADGGRADAAGSAANGAINQNGAINTNGAINGIANTAPTSASRRRFLRLAGETWVLVLAFSFFVRGLYSALRIPPIVSTTISTDKLERELRLAIITDMHLGKNLHREFLRGIVSKLNSIDADCVLIVGDLIDTDIDEIDYLDELDAIKVPAFYVFGNHEYYHDVTRIHERLARTNLRILNNTNEIFKDFAIAGVSDLAGLKLGLDGYAPNLDAASKGIDANKFNILLSHQPKFVRYYDVGRFDLVIAGHTHAGQIFPFSLLVLLEQGYLYGLYELQNNTKLYVSSGAGFWGPSVRFLAPSEIALLRIVSNGADTAKSADSKAPTNEI